MKKLIIEIPFETEDASLQLEEGDVDAIIAMSQDCSLFVEVGRPHSNTELADKGVAETFAIDVHNYSVRIEEVP